ncbi:hypothetical protein AV530_000791 [Patagioenas fasciata monilis]|uniref:Uncharacterized protein n=1 Tax=Patagioenas fasciata monilis TaxID=372326 RepID=A0A1V4KS86_PATFA|nr:hypothetical protein AV530_000791 [Patagioenas fasciata monilis]
MKPFRDGPFQLRFLNMAPTNITFAVLFGRRSHYEDPMFLTLLRLVDEVTHLLGSLFLHGSYFCVKPAGHTTLKSLSAVRWGEFSCSLPTTRFFQVNEDPILLPPLLKSDIASR